MPKLRFLRVKTSLGTFKTLSSHLSKIYNKGWGVFGNFNSEMLHVTYISLIHAKWILHSLVFRAQVSFGILGNIHLSFLLVERLIPLACGVKHQSLESKLNKEKQQSVTLCHISGANSQKTGGLLQLSALVNQDWRPFCLPPSFTEAISRHWTALWLLFFSLVPFKLILFGPIFLFLNFF